MSSMARPVQRIVDAHTTLEGAGFPVRRPIPVANLPQVDPFLLLDHLGPVRWGPGEAVGAPDHPHRGFETVTYLLEGQMEHKDSRGHRAVLGPGDVQWMTAGAGIVHSELPHGELLSQGGVLHGFQVWVNLPARDKMMEPRYQEVPAARIPRVTRADGKVTVRVIAGQALGVHARIDTRTPITYLHFSLAPGAELSQPQAVTENVLVYVFAGHVLAGPEAVMVREGQMAMFGQGDHVRLAVAAEAGRGAEVLLLAGEPLGEPLARYGPFAMNTPAEIQQAIRDYRAGRMGAIVGGVHENQ